MTERLSLSPIITLILALLGGCEHNDAAARLPTIYTDATVSGEFWVTVDGGEPQRLAGDARAYRPVVSRDHRWIALETRLASNRDIVRLFALDGDLFVEVGHITRDAWRRFGAEQQLDPDELSATRTRVAGFTEDSRKLRLELSAEEADSERAISMPVELALPPQPPDT